MYGVTHSRQLLKAMLQAMFSSDMSTLNVIILSASFRLLHECQNMHCHKKWYSLFENVQRATEVYRMTSS